MIVILRPLATALLLGSLVGCAAVSPSAGQPSPLVGAWLVTSARSSSGLGKNLLTFSSDGTFFRSGDTHPTLSGGHGAWKQVRPGEFEATYIAFRFDENRKWIGSTKTTLHVRVGESPNAFTGTAQSVNRDLDDHVVRAGESKLEGQRIVVDEK